MKKITTIIVSLGFVLVLSGCSYTAPTLVGQKSASGSENFLKSIDGGTSWQPKVKIDDKKTIEGADVISMAINPLDPNIIYLGTADSGLFVSKDGAETWTNVKFPTKAYGLVLDPKNPQVIYASGIFNGRGKIYKRESEDQEWKEIYTEPSDGTFISALAIDKNNPQVLYAGTNMGVVIKSINGGQSWNNLKLLTGQVADPIVSISFDAANSSVVYFAVFQRGLYMTRDGGANIVEITDKMVGVRNNGSIFFAIADPYFAGTLFVGLDNGILKGTNGAEKWESMNLIESSKKFPIRTIAINPKNSREIIYASAKALYKSVDGGVKWSTFQLTTAKSVGVLRYDPMDPTKVYAGLRSLD